MIKSGDIVGFKKTNNFKGIVLEEILNFLSKKSGFNIVKLPNKKANKIAVDSCLDSESEEVIELLIKGNASNIKKSLPIKKNIIKPLYLFLDEEILLYAKLRGLKFKQIKEKKNRITEITNEFEKNHPEVKRAIVNSVLKLYE
jgi:tRNA(Ile)-lysidine synthase TilS/MesJ